MTESQYIKLTSYFRKNKFRESIIQFLCHFTPLIVVFIYSITVLILFINKSQNLVMFLFVPASNFLFITILRRILNKPRPYDLFDHIPLVKYTKGKGKSFPSRHTSSAFIIAVSYFYIHNTYLALIMILIASIIALSRIAAGVHFPKDVVCAALISFIWSLIYWI